MNRRTSVFGFVVLVLVLAALAYWWPDGDAERPADESASTSDTGPLRFVPGPQDPAVSELVGLIDFHAWRPFEALLADLDQDGNRRLDGADTGMLRRRLEAGEAIPDLNGDGELDALDVDLAEILVGDADDTGLLDFNRDGVVRRSDYRMEVARDDVLAGLIPAEGLSALRGGNFFIVDRRGRNLRASELADDGPVLRIALPGLTLVPADETLRGRVPARVAESPGRLRLLHSATGAADAVNAETLEFTPDGIIPRRERRPGGIDHLLLDATADGVTLRLMGGDVAAEVRWLVWAELLWARTDNGFVLEGALDPGPPSADSKGTPSTSWLDVLLPTAHAADQGLAAAIASQLTTLEWAMRHRQAALERIVARLERDLAEAREREGETAACVRRNCEALVEALRAADRLAAVSEGARLLALQAVDNARDVVEAQAGSLEAIADGRDEVARILFWQQAAVRAGDIAADMLDALATGNPKAVGLDLLNYGTAYATDQAVGHQDWLRKGGEGAAPGKALDPFVGKLSAGLGKFGAFALDRSTGKVMFRPDVGATASMRHMRTLRSGTASPTAVRRARMAIAGPIIKAVIAQATRGAIDRTKADLARSAGALNRAQAQQMRLRLAVALYRHHVERIAALNRRNRALRERLFALKADCDYARRQGDCGAQLGADLERAAAERRSATRAWRQRLDYADEAVEDLAARRGRLFQRAKAIHAQVRKAVLAGEPAKAKRLKAKRASLWDEEGRVRKQLRRARTERRNLRANADEALQKARRVYLESVGAARERYRRCLGSELHFPPPSPEADKPYVDRGLIPVPSIFDPVNEVLDQLLAALDGSRQAFIDTRDCPDKEAAAGPVFDGPDFSGCWVGEGTVLDAHAPYRIKRVEVEQDAQGRVEAQILFAADRTSGGGLWLSASGRARADGVTVTHRFNPVTFKKLHAHDYTEAQRRAIFRGDVEATFKFAVGPYGASPVPDYGSPAITKLQGAYAVAQYDFGPRPDPKQPMSVIELPEPGRVTLTRFDVSAYELATFRATGSDFQTAIERLGPDARLYLSATAPANCERVVETLKVDIHGPTDYTTVALTETAADSGVFHSDPAGIELQFPGQAAPATLMLAPHNPSVEAHTLAWAAPAGSDTGDAAGPVGIAGGASAAEIARLEQEIADLESRIRKALRRGDSVMAEAMRDELRERREELARLRQLLGNPNGAPAGEGYGGINQEARRDLESQFALLEEFEARYRAAVEAGDDEQAARWRAQYRVVRATIPTMIANHRRFLQSQDQPIPAWLEEAGQRYQETGL